MSGNRRISRLTARACANLTVSMLALAISACGSGGGSKESPPPVTPPPVAPPPTTPPPAAPPPAGLSVTRLDSAPTDTQAHLRVTGALHAQEHGHGSGAEIALFTSGINTQNPLFAKPGMTITTVSFLNGSQGTPVEGDPIGQGTLLAGIISGSPTGVWQGGMVPGNNLTVVRVIPDSPKVGNPFGQSSQDYGLAAVGASLEYLRNRGVRIAGFSWDGDFSWSDAELTSQLVYGAEQYIKDGGLVVFAAGDGGKKDPTQLSRLPSAAGDINLTPNWLTVAAVETASPDKLASYSNACGVAMNYCLVAPGDVIVPSANSTEGNITYSQVRSTQAAMAQVAAAASMVAGAFEGMDAKTIREVLLTTTTDLGDPGVDAVFGHGLLNVGKAVHGPAHLAEGADFHVTASGNPEGRTWDFSNDISGKGGLTVGISPINHWRDELILSGRNTYTGTTTLYGNALTVTGSLDSPVLLNGNVNGVTLDTNLRPKKGRLDLKGGRLNGLLTITGQTLDFNAENGGTVKAVIDTASSISLVNTNLEGEVKLKMGAFEAYSGHVVRGSLTATDSAITGSITSEGDMTLSNSVVSGQITNTWTNKGNLLRHYEGAVNTYVTTLGQVDQRRFAPYGIIRAEHSRLDVELVNDGGIVDLLDSTLVGGIVNKAHSTAEYSYLKGIDSRGSIRLTRSSSRGDIANAGDLLLKDATIHGDVRNTSGGVLQHRGGSTINGDVSFGSGSILDFLEGNDALRVTGTAHINDGARIGWGKLNGPATDYAGSGREVLLRADGGVVGAFTAVARPYLHGAYPDSNYFDPFMTISIGQDDNSVWADFTRNNISVAATMFGSITPAALASAQRVETAFVGLDRGVDVSGHFLRGAGGIQFSANAEIARSSLQSLSGEMHARADAMTFDSLDASRRTVSMRFANITEEQLLLGAWTVQPGDPGQGLVGNATFSTSSWKSGSDLHIGSNMVIGLAFGENASVAHASLDERAHQKQTQMHLYAGSMRGNAYAMGQVGTGQYQRQLRRNLRLGSQGETVATDYGGEFFTAAMEAGYRLGATVPYVGVDFLHLRRDAFSEAGGSGFGLKTNTSSTERLQAVVGMRARQRWGRVGMHGFAEWQQSLSQEGLYAEASFVGIESWAPLQGADFGRTSSIFGVGLDADLGRRASWSFDYNQRVSSGLNDRQWSTKLRYGF